MKLNKLDKFFTKNSEEEIKDFKKVNADGLTPLIFALTLNKLLGINLSKEQFNFLIKNSDLNQVDKNKQSALMCAFMYKKTEKLNLSEDNLDYLIKNSDLKQIDKNGWSNLTLALFYNKKQKLNLKKEQWKYLIENSDLSLVKDEKQLIELKKIKSELLNEEILSKIDIKKEISKKSKI